MIGVEESPPGPRVLFCGAFKAPRNGTVGGVLFACQSLLATEVAKACDWKLIDSAQPLPPPTFPIRAFHAFARWINSIWCLLFGRIDSTLVFSPFLAMSLLEKMSICRVSTWLKKPTVVAFRSEIQIPKRSEWWMRPFMAYTLKGVRVICQSQQARDSLIDIFPSLKHEITVVPNWIAMNQRERSVDLPTNAKSHGICRISYVGWLEPIKDVKTILQSLAIVNQSNPRWQLTIAGSGSLSDSLRCLANDLGLARQVRFLGWVDSAQKASLLENTDLFVMASISEGMPNSIVEAMSFGLAVVASEVGGIPSLVQHDETGLLFPARDVASAVVCLQRLIDDPVLRTKFGNRGAAQIKADHNSERAAERILELLSTNDIHTDRTRGWQHGVSNAMTEPRSFKDDA